jgi:hypothetical protein
VGEPSDSNGRPVRAANRRWVPIAAAATVFLAAGLVARLAFDSRSDPRPSVRPTPSVDISSIPDVAEVVCDEAGATATTPVVRPQRDGIHVGFDNRAGYREYFLPDSEFQPSNGHGDRLPGGRTEALTENGPGAFFAGCFRNPADEGRITDPGYVSLFAIDPEGLYTPEALDCDTPERHVLRRVGPAGDLGAIVRTIPGVLPDDVVLRPGYPDEAFIFEPRVVKRADRAVARISAFLPSFASPPPSPTNWKLWVDACPGSGIGP